MDINKMVARVSALFSTPKTEWPVIAGEPATPGGLYRDYVLLLAAIPVLVGFINYSLVGIDIPLMGHYRVGIGAGLAGALVSYLFTLFGVYVTAWVVNALAPAFGGRKDMLQALKAVVFAYSVSWVAGIGDLLPWIGWLVSLAGGLYSVYLLNLGLPHTMQCPAEKSKGYTAVTLVVALLITWTVAGLGAWVSGVGRLGQLPELDNGSSSGGKAQIDPNSPLGQLAALGQRAEQASKRLEQAQKSGDSAAQQQAMQGMVGAILGGGAQVEALAPDRLKPFLPATLGDLKRSNFSAERNTAMGVQMANAEADYGGGDRSLHLEITDMGSAKGMMALAGWAMVQQDRETDHGYEKTYKDGDRTYHERWDSQTRSGSYDVVLGQRFLVKLSGPTKDMDQLKSDLQGLDLKGLEALKDEGVRKTGH